MALPSIGHGWPYAFQVVRVSMGKCLATSLRKYVNASLRKCAGRLCSACGLIACAMSAKQVLAAAMH